jgi:muconolactone delta-isomerase
VWVKGVEHRGRRGGPPTTNLVDDGHLVWVWTIPVAYGDPKVLGLYRAGSETELDALVTALPLAPWMRVTITPLTVHPNDPAPHRTVA